MASNGTYQNGGGTDGLDAPSIKKRYAEERNRRLLNEGEAQYVDVPLTTKLSLFKDNP